MDGTRPGPPLLSLPAGPGPGGTRPPLALLFMLGASLLVPLVFLLVSSWSAHDRLHREAHAAIERQTAVAKEHALKVVETNNLIMARLDDLVRGRDWAEIEQSGATLYREMRDMLEGLDQVASLHLVRPDGRLVLITIGYPAPPINLRSRGYFQQLERGERGPIFGPAQRGAATGIVAFTMSRRRSTPDGSFDGIIIASLLTSYFRQHWETMVGDGGFTISLLRRDGLVLAQHPPAPGDPAQEPPAGGPSAALRGATETHMTLADSTDRTGAQWLTGYRQVGDTDLYVSAGLSLSAVKAAWWRHVATTALICLLAAAALCFATLSALRRWRSEQQVRARLQRTADELGAEILRREAAEAGLRQAQRLEALGRLTGGMAHDFNNLLTAILGTVTMLERHLGSAMDDRARRMVAQAKDAVAHGARLNAGLLAFARRQPLRPAALDANALLTGFAPLVRQALGEAVPLQLDLAAGLPPCRADASQLEAALLNLAINARDAMPRGGSVTLRTWQAMLGREQLAQNTEASPGQFIAIAVRDSGEGMPPEVRDRAFDPFFTTKPAGKGTGLGLSQVFGFVRQLGGHVTLDSVAGQGTTVTLFLPVDSGVAELPLPANAEAEPVVAVARSTILMAEDDPKVRDVTAEMLREAGFRVLAAPDGQEALALLRRGEAVDLLFSDVVMPNGLSGFELAREARRLQPGLPVLLASGMAGIVPEPGEDAPEVLPKPYERATLLRRITALLQERAVKAG